MINEKEVMEAIKSYVKPKKQSMVTSDMLKITEMCRAANIPYAQIIVIIEKQTGVKIAPATLKEAWYVYLRSKQP